jgi:hypothetical protein
MSNGEMALVGLDSAPDLEQRASHLVRRLVVWALLILVGEVAMLGVVAGSLSDSFALQLLGITLQLRGITLGLPFAAWIVIVNGCSRKVAVKAHDCPGSRVLAAWPCGGRWSSQPLGETPLSTR